MKVEVKKLPKSQAEMTIEVSVFELQPFLTNTAGQMSKEMNFPGFRPGKAPYDMVKEKVGEAAIYQEAAEDVIRKTYPKAVIEQNLPAVGQPNITLEKLAPGNPMVYKAQVSLLPNIELGDYKKPKAKRKAIKVEQKEIDKAIKDLQKMYGKEIRVERNAAKGDKVEIDFDVFLDNVPLEGGASKNHPLVIGEGNFIPGFEENLVGMAKEQVKEFKIRFPKDYHKNDLANRLAEFKVKMLAVYKIELPGLNDEWAKMAGKFENFAELQKHFSQDLEKKKEGQADQIFEMEILDDIISKSKFEEIPELLMDSELDKMIKELEHDIMSQGMKFEDYLKAVKKTPEDLKKEFTPTAEKRIKTALIIRHIAKEEKIQVTPQEIEAEIKKTKETYKSQPEIAKQLDSPEYKMYLSNVLASKKVMEFLKNLVA
ncbi:MAG: trigger factor [Patescibacteria group bacterium]